MESQCRQLRTKKSGGHIGGFTLVETLVVVSIIAVLLALLLPAIRSVRRQMGALKCGSSMRSVAFKFQLFASGDSGGGGRARGRGRFAMNDFQESLYRIDEYWDLGQATTGILTAGQELLLCPAGPRQLIKRRGFPCGREAVRPWENVTLAMNMRLYRGAAPFQGQFVLAAEAATQVRPDVLSHPYVPLVMDVDGGRAVTRGMAPFYTAPPVSGRNDPYSDGRYWVPGLRHGGRANVGFVGGHVLASAAPERETWDWGYQAEVGR